MTKTTNLGEATSKNEFRNVGDKQSRLIYLSTGKLCLSNESLRDILISSRARVALQFSINDAFYRDALSTLSAMHCAEIMT